MSKQTTVQELNHKLVPKLDFYANNNRICLSCLYKGELWGKISINVPEAPLNPNEFIVKDYSENEYWALPYLNSHPEWFLPKGLVIQVSQYVTCPIYRVTKEFISEQFEATYNKKSDIYDAHPTLWQLYDDFVQAK